MASEQLRNKPPHQKSYAQKIEADFAMNYGTVTTEPTQKKFWCRGKLSRDNFTIAYKLLNDLLLIEVVFFLLALISEGLLPGIIATHVGFSKIIIIVGVTVLAIFYTGDKADIKLTKTKINKKTAVLLVLLLIAFLFSSLSRINITLNLFISLSATVAGFFTYKLLLGKN
jgi:hypothetical protein